MSQPRLLIKRSAPAEPPQDVTTAEVISAVRSTREHAPDQAEKGAPLQLISKDWQLQAEALSELLSDTETDNFVVGVLGGPGIGKSSFMNALLGAGQGNGAGGCAPFKVGSLEQRLIGQHCTSGIQIQVSGDGIVALDTQPLFSLSLLSEVSRWGRPSIALAGPTVAAAAAAKSNVAAFEAAQRLMELQAGVLLLSVCHLVVVLCDGLDDAATWRYLQTIEMLARGVPDPTLPHLPTLPQAAAGAGGKVPQAQQHLADILLLHVVDPSGTAGGGLGPSMPSMRELQGLEQSARTFFAPSRFSQPGPISLLDFLQQREQQQQRQQGTSAAGGGRLEGTARGGATSRLSWWVVHRTAGPDPPPAGWVTEAAAAAEEGEAWRAALLRRLLRYPRREFARSASQRTWAAGCARAWEAVVKSPEILDFYSRTVRTVHKGAGGWALAR